MTSPESERPPVYDRYNYLGYIGIVDIAPLVISPDNAREHINARQLRRYRSGDYSRFVPTQEDTAWAFDTTQQLLLSNVDAVTALAKYVAHRQTTPTVERDDIRRIAKASRYSFGNAIADSRFWLGRMGLTPSEALTYRPIYALDEDTVRWITSFPQIQMAGGLFALLAKLHDTHNRMYNNRDLPLEREVYGAMFEEWFAYTAIANRIAPDVWRKKFDSRTLMNFSLVDLLSRLQEQRLPEEQVVRTFAQRPNEFVREYDWLVSNNERKHTQRILSPAERKHVTRAKEVLAVQAYKNFASDLGYGNHLQIEKLEDVNDAIFAICAQQVANANEVYGEAQCNVWDKTVSKDIAEAVRPNKFHGRLSNIRIVRLPFDDQAMDEYFSSLRSAGSIDKDTATRIGIITDMYSTGRGKIGESFQDVVIYAENLSDVSSRRIKLSIRGNVSGDKVADYLRRESYGSAVLGLIKGMSHPVSGGLPSLGYSR